MDKEQKKKQIYMLVSDLSNCLLDVAEGYNVDTVQELEHYTEETILKILRLLNEI